MKKYKKILGCITGFVLALGTWCSPLGSMQAEADAAEIELLKTAISHLENRLSQAEAKVQALQTALESHVQNDVVTNGVNGKDGTDGVGISKIEQTATDGNKDTYTITLTNGNTYDFVITNGLDGTDGTDGTDGKDGTDGVGISKIEQTATDGNKDTYTITLTNGNTYDFVVTNGLDGKNGQDGADGADGKDGEDGENAVMPQVSDEESGSSLTVAATVVASVALLGNIIMAVIMMKAKK
ncbi:MAG: hypothetical protein IKL78_04740 [Lachnospiraceae bacterium]|nr:hypothetical protein [Lachnospiraceae bacterium]